MQNKLRFQNLWRQRRETNNCNITVAQYLKNSRQPSKGRIWHSNATSDFLVLYCWQHGGDIQGQYPGVKWTANLFRWIIFAVEVQGTLQDPWWSQGYRLWKPSLVKHLTWNSNSHLISAKIFLLFWKTKSGLELVSLSPFLHVIYRTMILTGCSTTKWISFYDCLYFWRYSAICSL